MSVQPADSSPLQTSSTPSQLPTPQPLNPSPPPSPNTPTPCASPTKPTSQQNSSSSNPTAAGKQAPSQQFNSLTPLRQSYTTSTFENDLPLLTAIYNLFKTSSRTLSTIPGLTLSLTIQPLPPATTTKSALLGGNSLGLLPSSKNSLVLCLISATWDTPSSDAQIANLSASLNAQIVAAAKRRRLHSEWVYLNYAGEGQDPIRGYGPANGKKLRAVSRKYDPGMMFQRNVPGGFKLFA